jgi:hypothetical protein
LQAWLAPYAAQTGPVCQWISVRRTVVRLGKALGIRWPKNGLRHSFATYRLAQCQDAAKVALEMGNTPNMIFRHYRELVTPQEAAAWWSISPTQAGNVLPIRGRQSVA